MNTSFDTSRRTLAVLIGFSMPISTALTNILCPVALLFLLAERRYQYQLKIIAHHPLASVALWLFILMILGFVYTSVSFSEAGLILDKYRELLYIPLFILLFQDEKSRQWGLYAFLSAMGVTLGLSYLMALTGWDIGKGTPDNPFIFKNYITQSLLMALAAYFVAIQYWQEMRWRMWRGLFILLALYNILFMSEGRTGYLVLFCLILLFFYQIYRWRGVLMGSLILILLSFPIYNHSDVVQKRVNKLSENLHDYQQGETETSVGSRLEFYKNSLLLIVQNPLLGTGTGSFTHEYQQLAQSQNIRPTTNPHNEYFMIAVQWGIIGVSLFIYLLYFMWYSAFHLKSPFNEMAQGLVIAMTVGCLVNSLLLDTTEGHIFAYLTGLFYSRLTLTQNSPFYSVSIKNIIKKPLLLIIFFLFLVLIIYQFLIAPLFKPIQVDKSIAELLMHSLPVKGPTAAIGLKTDGTTTEVQTPFQSTIQTQQGQIGPQLTVLVSDRITVSSRVQFDPGHVGQLAHFMMLVSYEKAGTPIWFQRQGQAWQPLTEANPLTVAQSVSQLPARLDLEIYPGPLRTTGPVNIFIAYWLPQENLLVLNNQPIHYRVLEPPVAIDEKVALIMKVAASMMTVGQNKNAIAFDNQGTEIAVTSQFKALITTQSGLSGNHLTLSSSDIMTAATQIEIDPRHSGQAAYVIMIALYQSPTEESKLFFQRNGLTWTGFELNQLKSAQSISALSNQVDLQIYQGSLATLGVTVGKVSVFVGYLLEEGVLVMNRDPLSFSVKSNGG